MRVTFVDQMIRSSARHSKLGYPPTSSPLLRMPFCIGWRCVPTCSSRRVVDLQTVRIESVAGLLACADYYTFDLSCQQRSPFINPHRRLPSVPQGVGRHAHLSQDSVRSLARLFASFLEIRQSCTQR